MAEPVTELAGAFGQARLLEGRVVLVTGGNRGIGRAIVEAAVGQGARVSFTYAKQDGEAKQVVEHLGSSAVAFNADVRDLARSQAVVAETIERFGRLDGVVNNAGIVRDKALMMMSSQEWQEVLDTNLTGTFNICRAAIVTLMKQKYGRIINIASVAGIAGVAGQVNYSASKAGIIGLTRSLAKEVAGYGITVNAVAPGFVETDMIAQMADKRREEAIKQIPLGRFGKTEEVARLVAYLLSNLAGYLTGQTIVIDGGLML